MTDKKDPETESDSVKQVQDDKMYMLNPSHPRYTSLKYRELLARGVKMGITSLTGLTAHGRGEAFDYLIGEKTNDFALDAVKAAAALLLSSKKPIISVNGNVAVLVPKEIASLADALSCAIEINLFHFTKQRIQNTEKYLKKYSKRILSTSSAKVILPNIASRRKITLRDGIGASDCVFVPLEDGDRAQALVGMNKSVITIDLNPLSRTAQCATITIVDNIIRVLPLLVTQIEQLKGTDQKKRSEIIKKYNNKTTLSRSLQTIQTRLEQASKNS
jgi:4-phosphopantoate---beta-alanine ligase